MRSLRIALLVLAAALAVPGSAWAHAALVRTEPANGAVLARGPAQVSVVFDDVVRAGPGVEAVRNDGASVLAGGARVVGGRTLVIPLRTKLQKGDYSVRWTIISDDGHLESGVLAFAVGLGRASPHATLSAQAAGPTPDAVSARWIFLGGLLAAVGLTLFVMVVRPGDEERIPVALATAGIAAALGAAQEVHRVGLSTRDGKALGTAFVVALVVATAGAAATLDRRALKIAYRTAPLLAIFPSLSGHALDHGLPRINVVADVVHLLAASAWIGVLLGLVLVRGADVRRAATLALGAVAVIGITGVIRAAYELTGVSQVWGTSYGRALLVKTGLLLAAIGLGWLLRADVRRRAVVEVVVVAALVAAVAVLVELRPGRDATAAARVVQASQPADSPPAPPRGAVVLAREADTLGVALASEPARATALVLSPAGGGLSGLDVRIDGVATRACGSGCYVADTKRERAATVDIAGFGPVKHVRFALPPRAPAADALLRRTQTVYRALRSVGYRERLASSPGAAIVARWTLEAPDRVRYVIAGGAQGVVIGAKRWDRDTPGGRWVESEQTPLPQPGAQWRSATNAHLIAQTPTTSTISFADPTIPGYFTVTFDRRSLRPRVLHMVAASHFMTDSYDAFNEPRSIRPPR